METEIGDAAGISWKHLDQRGETTLSKLKRETKFPDHLFLMALGWLAREDKVRFQQAKRSLKVSLKSH